MSIKDATARMCAEVRGELQGPETLQGMIALFEEYQRCLRLAEHNRSGRNPRYPGAAGRTIGGKLQAKADHLAECFPEFSKALKRLDRRA